MNPNSQSNTRVDRIDHIAWTRNLLMLVGVFGTVFFAGYTLKTGNIFFMTGLVALPFMLMLVDRPDIAFLLGVVMDASDATVGGINYLTVGLLMQLVVVASIFLRWSLRGHGHRLRFAEDRPLKYFVAVILILMALRGTGLRFLGSETWGGMIYIKILLCIAFYLAVRGVDITTRQIKLIIIGSVIAGLIGSIIQRAGFISSGASLETGLIESVAQKRLMWLIPFVWACFPVVLAIRWRFKLLGWFYWLFTVAVIGMTGFRSRLIGLVMVTFLFGLIRSRERFKYCVMSAGVGILLWIMIIISSPFMPIALQRAVSFVPGASVAVKTMSDAEGSVEWRVEIWKYCLQRAPHYLILGRGSAFNVGEAAENLSSADIQTYTPWFAFLTRSYHSGPLTLLLDYGLAGFIFGIWLSLAIIRRIWKTGNNLARINSVASRYTQALICLLLWELISFFMIFGSMPKFGNLIILAATVTVLSSSVLRKARQDEEKRLLQEKADPDMEPVA